MESLNIGTPRELFAREEILARAGLESPPITQLLRLLNVNKQALTLDEAEKIILSQWKA
ncbi:MAG: hypothetical protein II857_00870 [Selenomonadaceae bacterium]|nr:hypothetical protein [Selenomonadaceae bacterium]